MSRSERLHWRLLTVLLMVLCVAGTSCRRAGTEPEGALQLMNVSFDASRPFYAAYNEQFADRYRTKHHRSVSIRQSHGGSSKQARSVIDGLEADVVTLALPEDIDALAAKSGLVAKNWRERFANSAAPFSSTIVMLVRTGNPKAIRDFSDLTKPELSIIVANPKTSGGARLAYLALWAYALKQPGGNDDRAREFVKTILAKVPVMDSGARAALTTFVERNLGDVMLSWENEALLAAAEIGKGKVQVVTPTLSVLAEPPVAVVDGVAAKHGTETLATDYLRGLWEHDAQELAARSYLRPRDVSVLAKYSSQFPSLDLVRVEELFGSWARAQSAHFAEGGVFDQIMARR